MARKILPSETDCCETEESSIRQEAHLRFIGHSMQTAFVWHLKLHYEAFN